MLHAPEHPCCLPPSVQCWQRAAWLALAPQLHMLRGACGSVGARWSLAGASQASTRESVWVHGMAACHHGGATYHHAGPSRLKSCGCVLLALCLCHCTFMCCSATDSAPSASCCVCMNASQEQRLMQQQWHSLYGDRAPPLPMVALHVDACMWHLHHCWCCRVDVHMLDMELRVASIVLLLASAAAEPHRHCDAC
jgi:hypothetical protein